MICLFIAVINAQFATEEQVQQQQQQQPQQQQPQQQQEEEAVAPHPRKLASTNKIGRADGSILKKRERSLHKVRKYQLKVESKLGKTIALITKARNTFNTRSSALVSRLAKYGTRKLTHLVGLYNMADDDVKQQLKPMVAEVTKRIKEKEVEVAQGANKLTSTFFGVLDRTIQQLEEAKRVADANNNAANAGIHAVGDNISKGIRATQNSNQLNTRDLRKIKKTSKDAQKKIAHELHKAERKEVAILKNARAILKQMRTKGKHIFSKLRHQVKADYRELHKEALSLIHI